MASNCVLSDIDIFDQMRQGNIVISPFDEDSLSNCSYDVKLGNFFFRNETTLNYFNPWSKRDVDFYWGSAIYAEECPLNEEYLRSIPAGERMNVSKKNIVLDPGETVLAHTEEFIGGRKNITTMMKARSSLGRCGIAICKCAGMLNSFFYLTR